MTHLSKLITVCLFGLFLSVYPAGAEGFKWIDDFNQQAARDMDAFKDKVAERFAAKREQVEAVIKEMKTPSDTYMAFKLSEMADKPVTDVAQTYSKGKAKGWGALAKSMGIKPGSQEFHQLKQTHDLDKKGLSDDIEADEDDDKGKGKGKGKDNSGKGNKGKKK